MSVNKVYTMNGAKEHCGERSVNDMNNSEALTIATVCTYDALMHMGEKRKHRYSVWKKVGNTNMEIGRFLYREMAEAFVFSQHQKYKSMRFQITNIGKTPVWN